jgi:hypothetical protein
MKLKFFLLLLSATFTLASCRERQQTVTTESKDSLKPTEAKSAKMPSQVDTMLKHTTVDTSAIAHPPSDLPPIATPIAPEKLAQFLPAMEGYTASVLEQESKVRKNFSSSKVSRTFTKGAVKIVLEVDDFAYVPFLYQPFDKYKDTYLDDDNVERTETTTIKGYHAVQTWEKQSKGAQITLFPGKRYVVRLTGDGLTSINDARSILESMNLGGLESLQ